MRTVVNGNEVPHLWYHNTQAEARNSNGSLYFNGDTIYSYGSHFPIARHIVNKKGVKAVLFTTRRYSNTTAKHISYVRRAIPDEATLLFVANPANEPSNSDLDAIQADINEQAKLVSRATIHKDWKLGELDRLVGQFKALASFIGSKRKPLVPDDKWLAEQKALAKEKAKAEAIARAERERKALEFARAELIKWQAGQSAQGLYHLPFDYMRIEGDEIVTTKGARVPLEHVAKVAPLIVSLIDKGESYQRNGHSIHLGNYVIDSLSSDGVLTVGCHRFDKDELLRVADLIKS